MPQNSLALFPVMVAVTYSIGGESYGFFLTGRQGRISYVRSMPERVDSYDRVRVLAILFQIWSVAISQTARDITHAGSSYVPIASAH